MANPAYDAAYQVYLDSGNLARAAREARCNENSLRDYARHHGWEADRARHLAHRAEARHKAEASVSRLVGEFYQRPEARKAQLARAAIELSELLGTAGSEVEVEARGYAGGKDAYRELVMACLQGAMKRRADKEIKHYLQLLGEMDGHLPQAQKAGPGAGGTPQPPPDFAALRDLADPAGEVFVGPGESAKTG